MPLPIYDIIEKNLSAKKHALDADAKKKLLAEIYSCSHQEMEILFGLILSYCERESIDIVYFPFDSRQTIDGIEFSLDALPSKLQMILHKFVTKTRKF